MSFSNKFKELEEESYVESQPSTAPTRQVRDETRRVGPVMGNRFQAQREQEVRHQPVYRLKDSAPASTRQVVDTSRQEPVETEADS